MPLRLAVLMGGPSREHPISLASARVVLAALDPEKYAILPFLMGRDRSWRVPEEPLVGPFDLEALVGTSPRPLGQALELLAGCDVAFPVMHGDYGEDGRIQGLLDCLGVPYVGSGVGASALAIDKIHTKILLDHAGLDHAPYRVVRRDQARDASLLDGLVADLGPRLVVKSPTLGSSHGVFLVEDRDSLADALEQVLADEERCLVEVWLSGREVTCAVLEDPGGGPLLALPPTEILPPEGRSFDFEAKYTPGMTREVTPPEDMPGEWIERIQTSAVRIHEVLGLAGLSRADMMLDAEGRATLLEVNTMPGMTETSLLPQAARCAGLELPQLLDRLIATAARDRHSPGTDSEEGPHS